MKKRKHVIAHDAFEIADVLGLEKRDAIAMEFRARLNRKIVALVRARGLTHADVARLARGSRTRITAILNGHTLGVSTDFLLRVLYALGCKTVPTFSSVRTAA